MKINKLFAEFLGTALLVATVVGTGIMATTLTKDVATQLLMVALATGIVLAISIKMLAPISGAHFNPVVSMVMLINKQISIKKFFLYMVSQTLGGVFGVIVANLMFDLPGIQNSTHARIGSALFLGEVVATAGLLIIIQLIGSQNKGRYLPFAVGGWITAAHLFTSSTSFANPAVTFARSLTDTFAGIKMSSVPGFIAAQIFGALLAIVIAKSLKNDK